MYHDVEITTLPAKGGSLTFSMYRDFFMVPTALPVISAPGVKTKTIDIPGANGAIDLAESLTPYPVYNNRTGSLEFALLDDRFNWYKRYSDIHKVVRKNSNDQVVINKVLSNTMAKDSSSMWSVIYSGIMNAIHGRKCRITLVDDDPQWYYEGRIAVNSWKTSNDGKWPVITLDYDLYPYKLAQNSSVVGATELNDDRWQWDPFSFIDGVIYSSNNISLPSGFTADGLWKNITVNTNNWTTYGIVSGNSTVMDRNLTGWMPVCPSITVSANSTNMGIKITNPELGYTYEKAYTTSSSEKTYTDPECLLYDYLGDGYELQLKGHGSFTIDFRKGSL